MQPHFVKKLNEFFSHRSEIHTAILFGSFVKGRVQRSSDIDFALLLQSDSLPKNTFDYTSELSLQLETICSHEADIVILNLASPHIAFRAIKEGKIIYQNSNRSLWNAFVVKTISMNEDMEILYRKIKRG